MVKKKKQKVLEKNCPRCGHTYRGFGALSRRDNRTMICSPCGTDEALIDWAVQHPIKNKNSWEKD
jgi:transcription elongation factor Elf1